MELKELEALWKSEARAGEDAARWTAREVDDFRRRRSTSVAAVLARQLAVDLVVNAAAGAALAAAAWVNRHDPLGCGLALAGLGLTLVLAWPLSRAFRQLRAWSPAGDVLEASARLLGAVRAFRSRLACAAAASGSLLLAAWFLVYFPVEYGRFRPDQAVQRAFIGLLLAVPFVASLAVRRARLRSAVETLTACVRELDESSLQAVRTAERRADRILVAGVGLIGLVFAAGLLLFLAG
ncbi:MAG: hypothetical protein ACYDBY_00520 [Thermoanaerobaculia bacterium]